MENQVTFCSWVGGAKITLALRYMKNKNFFFDQTAKVVNSKKILAAKGSNFVHDEEFSPIFQIIIF